MRSISSLLLISFVGASSRPNFLFWTPGAVADQRCSVAAKQEVDTETINDIDSKLSAAESTIQEYLKTNTASTGKFHVQGWRWHTMSLVRDARRLGGLAQRMAASSSTAPINDDDPEQKQQPLLRAVDFVIDFNMKGLHKVEADLFIPWMRQTVQTIRNRATVQAFTELLDRLDQDRNMVAQLGHSLV
jgi:hypothetical protein